MIKSKLTDGTPIFIFTTRQRVRLSRFALALTDYFWRKNSPDEVVKVASKSLSNLTKKGGLTILLEEMNLFGQQGEHPPGFFDASGVLGEKRNDLYKKCQEWVAINYPYLEK